MKNLFVALAVFLGGCVTVYQPLVNLQRPTVIDTETDNFKGQRLLLRCIPGEALSADAAQLLCRRLRSLFANQGAEVQVQVPQAGSAPAEEEGAPKADLVMDLRARVVNTQNSGLLWALSFLTLTLVPTVTEYSFIQTVVVRDANGFQLARDDFEGRFLRYFGAGVWAVNSVLDWLVRSEEENLSGKTVKRDFSRDFYRQLSQVALHASTRALVMRNFSDEPSRRPSPTPAVQ